MIELGKGQKLENVADMYFMDAPEANCPSLESLLHMMFQYSVPDSDA